MFVLLRTLFPFFKYMTDLLLINEILLIRRETPNSKSDPRQLHSNFAVYLITLYFSLLSGLLFSIAGEINFCAAGIF